MIRAAESASAHRAPVPAVADSSLPRPRWSVMIPTYDCAGYLREALASVLAQDPGPARMQIEVVDDHSTRDDPEAVVRELGAGRVGFFRQPANVGHVRNFNTALARARGELVHLLHGDDAVRPGFYAALERVFDQRPDLGAAFSRTIFVDPAGRWLSISGLHQLQSGVLENWLERIASEQRIFTPSIVVPRAIYEALGGFDDRITHAGEDWEMWVRIACRHPMWFEIEPLAVYRDRRPDSLSANSIGSGAFVEDMRIAADIVESYLDRFLPPSDARRALANARGIFATWALGEARSALARGGIPAARVHLRTALALSREPSVFRRAGRMLAGHVARRSRARLASLVQRAGPAEDRR